MSGDSSTHGHVWEQIAERQGRDRFVCVWLKGGERRVAFGDDPAGLVADADPDRPGALWLFEQGDGEWVEVRRG